MSRPRARPAARSSARRVTRRTTSRTRVCAALLATLVVATGCGPVNAGDADATAFERWMASEPGVASTEIDSMNVLPWMGEVDALIVTEPDLDQDTLDAIVERTIAFEPRASGVEAFIQTTLDGVTIAFAVSPTKIDNDASRELALAVARIDGVTVVTVDQEYGNVDRDPVWGLEIVTSANVSRTRQATLDLLVERGEVAKTLDVVSVADDEDGF